jgi:hypothetical protein
VPALARADVTPLSQGFERGLGDWQATAGQSGSGWQVVSHPETVPVAIDPRLVTLGGPVCADGTTPCLPPAADGEGAAWFGDPANGTYCSPVAERQTPEDGCTSTGPIRGELTSPSFSLAGHASAYLHFDAWWEIEAVNADVADQMSVWYWTPDLGWNRATVWPGDNPAAASLVLNPLDPAWGGVHQAYSDDGARTSGSWRGWVADLSPAVGSPEVRVRFGFDTIDEQRNGFRGWLVDDVAVEDALGAPVDDDTTTFGDGVPSLSITGMGADPNDDGTWHVHFHVHSSHPSPDPVSVGWAIADAHGHHVAGGNVTIPPGQTDVGVDATVPGGGAPYTATLVNPTNATIDPVQGSGIAAGPTLPTLSLGTPTVTASADPSLMAVTVPVALDQAVPFAAAVDYTVAGNDASALATGTITVASGQTSGSATVLVPLDSLPATVTLANPVNAILGPASASVTPPAAGASATGGGGAGGTVSGQGDAQLVLGARQGAQPLLGRTFQLSYVSGTLRYHQPGKPYVALSAGSVMLPMGSVVDARNGHARIVVESLPRGSYQTGEFWAGVFGVFQQPNPPGFAEFNLAAGDFSACPGAARSHRRAAHASARKKPVRRLWGSAKGNFRTKGRFASATVRGTRWLTEDLCLATRVTVAEGIVSVFDFRRKTTTAVRAGDSVTVGALQSARYRKRRGTHRPRLSRIGG